MPDNFPYDPDWRLPGLADKRVLISKAVSGATKSRTKTGTKRAFELGFEARDKTEFDAAYAFWSSRYPGTTFNYIDNTVSPSVTIVCQFTSPFTWVANAYNDYDYKFSCEEV